MVKQLEGLVKVYRKVEQSVLANKSRLLNHDLSIMIPAVDRKALSVSQRADLGTTAIFIEEGLQGQLEGASAQIKKLFSGFSTCHRAKGAASISAKLENYAKKFGGYTSHEQAVAAIEDGIGSRIFSESLRTLNKKEIAEMVDNTFIEGRKLSQKEKTLLTRYIYGKRLSPTEENRAFALFERFATPLIEQHSAKAVDRLCLGMAKFRMTEEGLTLAQMKQKGLLPEHLMQELERSFDAIEPIQIKVLNNYRGIHGLPEFSARQIEQIRDIAGPKVVIYSRPDLLDYSRFPNFKYTEKEMKELALKPSGYRTAQAKILHSNGALGEIQFRGFKTNDLGEYEHLAYDFRRGKGVESPVFAKYKAAVQALSDAQYEQYNLYLEKWYNYYNRLELGLPAVKPRLPKGFNKVLSVENLRKMHDLNEARLADLKKTFVPYMEDCFAVA